MLRFAHPHMLYLLLLLLLITVAFVVLMHMRRERLRRFGNPEILAELIPDSSLRRVYYKFFLYLAALVLIVVALARPQAGSKLKEVTNIGVEIMFVVDVSNSMLAEDFTPNRLERTKYSISRLIEGMKQDRVGLIVFAGDAYVMLPITSDYVAARNFANQISPNLVSKQGTAIGAAIELASGSFSSDSDGSRVIILISDGENHEDDALIAAEAAATKGIKIYAIGIGTPEGAPISINGNFIKDEDGNMVVSKLDESSLQEIALHTGGAYIRASSKSVGLTEIVGKINQTEKREFTTSIFDEFNELYQYFIGAAILLLLLNSLMLSRKNHILKRFNVFKNRSKI